MNQQAVHAGRIFRFHCVLIRCEPQQTDEPAAPGAKRLRVTGGGSAQHNAPQPCSSLQQRPGQRSDLIASSISGTQKPSFLQPVAQLHVCLTGSYKASSE
ncbi:unnamed protein product [Coccothraustes coccothraustes]